MLFFTISQNTQENICAGALFLTKMMTVKRASANGWFWFLEIYFYNSKRFPRTENHAHAIRYIWPKFVKVHFLNLLYDHKDYANFDNAFSVVMKNFPEPIGLQTNTSFEDGNKSDISNWERDVLNLKEDAAKIVKNLIFRTMLLIPFNNCEGKCPQIPKMSLCKRGIRKWCFTKTPYCSSGI